MVANNEDVADFSNFKSAAFARKNNRGMYIAFAGYMLHVFFECLDFVHFYILDFRVNTHHFWVLNALNT